MTPTPAVASNSERLVVKLGLVGLKTLYTVDVRFPDRRRQFFIDGKHNQDNSPGALRAGAGLDAAKECFSWPFLFYELLAISYCDQ